LAAWAFKNQKAGLVAGGDGVLGDQLGWQVEIEVLSQHFQKELTKSVKNCWKERIFETIDG
jgi:hypothetical protein